jgi:hypothetical protein
MLVTVAEWQHRDYMAISADDRSWFYTHKRPPQHWRMWVASCSNGFPEQYMHSVLQLVDDINEVSADETSFEPNTHTTTFRVRHILFHVMSSSTRAGRRAVRDWRWRFAAIDSKIAPLWPIRRNISWPLRNLTDSETHTLANGFFEWHGDVLL